MLMTAPDDRMNENRFRPWQMELVSQWDIHGQ